MNEWLDKMSKEMAISKTALIAMALENYRKEVEVISIMPQIKEKLLEMGIQL